MGKVRRKSWRLFNHMITHSIFWRPFLVLRAARYSAMLTFIALRSTTCVPVMSSISRFGKWPIHAAKSYRHIIHLASPRYLGTCVPVEECTR